MVAVTVVLTPCATVLLTSTAHGQVPLWSAEWAQSAGPEVPVVPIVSPQVVTQPRDGATDVLPTAPVRVSVNYGVLDAVSLTNPEGKLVAGQLSTDRSSWVTTEPLGYAKTYTWSGTATGIDHLPRAITGSFRTVVPVR
ncbi:MAG: Ig-like domain-containing protein, partial [Pseudonocardiaceae bacterium]